MPSTRSSRFSIHVQAINEFSSSPS
jgi:hypothetical protein